MRRHRQIVPLLAAAGSLMLLFRAWVPRFLEPTNLIDLAQQISVNAIIAFGMTLVILIGGIDLSVGALLALVGTTTVHALVSLRLGPAGALGLGLAVAAGVGLFNGACAARTPMPPFIITLATMQVARGAALRFNEGRPMHVPDEHALFLALGNGRMGEYLPAPVLVMLALFTGIAGMIHAAQLYSAEPASGVGFELNAIAAAVVGGTSFTGGRGTMHGTLIGAVIIGVLDKGLNQAGVHFSFQYIIKGLVILGAVFLDARRRRA